MRPQIIHGMMAVVDDLYAGLALLRDGGFYVIAGSPGIYPYRDHPGCRCWGLPGSSDGAQLGLESPALRASWEPK